MQCYTELLPPTAVTHSISLPFLSSSANNLVVAKTNLLQIFALKSVINTVSELSYPDPAYSVETSKPTTATARSERQHETKLVLLAHHELSGTITSLARVKLLQSISGGEALLVALRDAKLSLIEWDPEKHSISTISIHYYEKEDILSNPWEPELSQCVTQLSVDPSSRCAALKFGARHLAILPFHQTGDELAADDLAMDDYDPDIDGERLTRKQSTSQPTTNGVTSGKTPYAASFVLSLLALDPVLTHPLHISFLYEYREPTFGILYSQVARSTALLPERRDNVYYSVYTLDLEQRASTTLLSLNGLPYDLFTIIPLSRSIGGALLIGGNEIIHVDQSGKTTGVAVNELAKQCTSFALGDQSDLGMRLEHCVIKQLGPENTDLLLILNTGELAVISFKIDGRSVSGLSIRSMGAESGGRCPAGASCASAIGRGRLFIGSEDCNSLVLGWSRGSDRLKRQKSRLEVKLDDHPGGSGVDSEDLEEDEDDLYAATKVDLAAAKQVSSPSDTLDEYRFRMHDALSNLGPLSDVAFRNHNLDNSDSQKSIYNAEILTTSGRGTAGELIYMQQNITVTAVAQYDLTNARGVWSVTTTAAAEGPTGEEDLHNYIIVSNDEKSTAYKMKPGGPEELSGTEFEADAGPTVDVGTISNGTKTVQVLQSDLRIYDGDFGLSQILPLADEDSDAEPPKLIHASFADPYVLLIAEDYSAMVLTEDDSGDIEIIAKGDALKQGKWLSGSLWEDSNDALRIEFPEDSDDETGNVLLLLLSTLGGLQVFRLPNLQKPVYIADGLSFLPPFLSEEFNIRRSSARENLTELLMTELGDSTHKSPYLILRSAFDDLIIYQPYQSPIEGSQDTALRWSKVTNPYLPRSRIEESLDAEQQRRRQPLRVVPNAGGYSTVFMPGSSPCFILKSASSLPHTIELSETSVASLCPFHTPQCQRGFLYINGEGKSCAAQLPQQSQFETGWVTRRKSLGKEVYALTYYPEKDVCVLGTSNIISFKLPEDDFHTEWAAETTTFLPQVEQGSIELLDCKTLSKIGSHDIEPHEIIMTIKTLSLEVSEHTHERQSLVCVGTSILRGEDLPSTGHIYIFAVIDVVPDPERPETGTALKLLAKEEVKGAVTALSGVGTQGFLMVAQGQKCMVRGLKEDGSLLPVAFMDMQCYVSVLKELPGTGLCLMGDVVKGVWLTGYMEEPYQLRLFGKSPRHIEVVAADMLPDGKQLYMAVADADCNIHILQFDPDHPKSLSGQRLLHHTTFHTSHYPSTITLVPSTTPSSSPSALITSTTGSLALLTPLPPSAYRTLSALQSHLQTTLTHPLGLNPRGYRMPSQGSPVGEATAMGRGGVVDGMVIRRWMEGGRWRWWSGDAGDEGGGVREVVRRATGRDLFR